jgi:hypothetical protein
MIEQHCNIGKAPKKPKPTRQNRPADVESPARCHWHAGK